MLALMALRDSGGLCESYADTAWDTFTFWWPVWFISWRRYSSWVSSRSASTSYRDPSEELGLCCLRPLGEGAIAAAPAAVESMAAECLLCTAPDDKGLMMAPPASLSSLCSRCPRYLHRGRDGRSAAGVRRLGASSAQMRRADQGDASAAHVKHKTGTKRDSLRNGLEYRVDL
jgi:hypothetical protein